ncbi:MAG TPA: glycoside hydrolase family 3 C-terminal domain-containing protein [Armatimonadota bacterium]|jgi:beta-glucosidase
MLRVAITIAALIMAAAPALAALPFEDPSLPIEQRVDDLVGRLTLDEKAAQMQDSAPAIPRLNLPAYGWWNEALHGVARNGTATVFPQAIGLAAMWDAPLHHQAATVISDEARAKYNEALRQGKHDRYAGLTFWSPNINIFRDPRWGRGQETYGEDPYLTGRLGVAFVKGLQGDDPKYLKTVSTPKHFAVHSGPEPSRHRFNAVVSDADLYNTYLPAFEATIREANAQSVMCAYNRTDGEPCCASNKLLAEILRGQWGFTGYVVSDCDAVADIYRDHKTVATPPEAAAAAVRAGDDLNCGDTYRALPAAVRQGLISEAEVDVAVKRLFTARFRLGMFDPPALVKYSQIPFAVNDSPQHNALALKAARESIVLLKNAHNALPLSRSIRRLAVIGPNADDGDILLGNYNGDPSHPVNILRGIRNRAKGIRVTYNKGCELASEAPDRASALENARAADAVVLVMGISPRLEGEEMDVQVEGFSGGDRLTLDLPAAQQSLMEEVVALGKPVVLVLASGSALSIPWADAHVPAIVQAWYPGQQGGAAVADVLFGNYNPAGRLPVTYYRSVKDLPAFDDYSMAGRTYRYFRGKALYPFGHGLSYTTFRYANLRVSPARAGRPVYVAVDVTNTGRRAGDEVVQLYVRGPRAGKDAPLKELKGFQRTLILPGKTATVRFTLDDRAFAQYNTARHRYTVTPGAYQIQIGASSEDIRATGTVRQGG